MKLSRKRNQFVIFFIDICILVLSLFLTFLVRHGKIASLPYYLLHTKYFIPIFITWIVMLYTLNYYSLEKDYTTHSSIIGIFFIAVLASLIGFAEFYLLPNLVIFPKTVLVIFNILTGILLVIWRVCYSFYFFHYKRKINVILIENNDTIPSLLAEIQKFSYFKFAIKGIYLPSETDQDIPKEITVFNTVEDLEKASIETAVYVLPHEYPLTDKKLSKFLFSELSRGCMFFSLPNFYELISRKIPLGAINETWLIQNITTTAKKTYFIVKRLVDILISLILLVPICAITPFVALIIKLESSGPVFFKQNREGQKRKIFTIYKFRTMTVDNNDFKPTGVSDNRITKFGNFMRKTRIDELPQIFNVLKGDMSLIGPRPERPELSIDLEKEIPFYTQRLIVKPGITGWDQVSGEYHSPSVEDTYKKLQYDLYYIKNISLSLDISIFFKTIMTIFKKVGR
ncbi:MAG: sugar transferase [Spirochaetaceae bacterium]|nr:sugar transferase [Spirochaetaceae bacterium]